MCGGHSGLILAARITLAHFSVSSAMNLLKPAGDNANTVPPKSAIRAFSLGSARPALISLLSLSMSSRRALWCTHAVPRAHLVAWDEFDHRRNVRQGSHPLRAV